LPLNPHVGLYKWLTLDPRIFMPPWYPLVVVYYEPTSKLPYKKLQYPTYVKGTNFDVHIRVFKEVIKANKEIMKAGIINLNLVSLLKIISQNGVKTLYKIIPTAHLKCWKFLFL
jgi:hypothetical protein